MPFRILSIDGGGLRGIMAVKVIQWIESMTGQSILDSFDLFAGTSTGGLIVSALTVAKKDEDKLKPLYSSVDVENIYRLHGHQIFPPATSLTRPLHSARNMYRPRFSEKGIDDVLSKYLGGYRLTDCIRPVLITTYDLSREKPVYFTRRSVYQSSTEYNANSNINAELKKICRATSAAPVYLPSYSFLYADKQEDDYWMNCIDGGVYSNNPALAAYIDVITNLEDPLYKKNQVIGEKDIYIVSIGTGQSNKSITHRQSKNWGIYRWGKTVTDVMMQGNSQAVDYQLDSLLDYRYLRINTDIEFVHSNMVDPTRKTLDYLCEKINTDVLKNEHFIEKFTRFARLSGMPLKQPETELAIIS